MKQNVKLVILVVLYKVLPKESDTLKSLLTMNFEEVDAELIIWDNSPYFLKKQDFEFVSSRFSRYSYMSHPENTALSVVYNSVSEIGRAADYMIFLDQDSKIPSDYINVFLESRRNVLQFNCNLYLPIIRSEDKIVSPGRLVVFKGVHDQDTSCGLRKTKVGLKTLLAITSGMIVSMAYLRQKTKPFDERLSLYGVDTKFMMDFALDNDWACVMPIQVDHHTTLWSSPPVDVLLRRTGNLFLSWKIIFPVNTVGGLIVRCYIGYQRIKLALQRRDVRFLR